MTQAPDITTREELRQFGRDLCQQSGLFQVAEMCSGDPDCNESLFAVQDILAGLTVSQGYGLATDEIAEIVLSGYRVQLVDEQKPFPLP